LECRSSYEKAIAEGGYGRLLTLWDKREEHGKRSVVRALEDINKLKKYKRGIHLSYSIIYPTIPEVL